MFEGIFCSKFNLVLVGVVRGAPTVNAFLCHIYTPWSLLDPDTKGVDAFGCIIIILFIDFGVIDDLENCVYKVYRIFCLCGPNY